MYMLHLDAVVLAGYSKHVLLSLAQRITSPERPAGVPPCVWESVNVPLRAEWAWPGTWRAPDATAERLGRRCVELASAGDSAARGPLRSSARRRVRRIRTREASCRSYSASLPGSRCRERESGGMVTASHPTEAGRGRDRSYSHNGAGVASLLAALADQEGPGIFALKHLLSLRPAHFTNKPVRLILMRQVLLIAFQNVCTKEEKAICVITPAQGLSLMMKPEVPVWALTRPGCRSARPASR